MCIAVFDDNEKVAAVVINLYYRYNKLRCTEYLVSFWMLNNNLISCDKQQGDNNYIPVYVNMLFPCIIIFLLKF